MSFRFLKVTQYYPQYLDRFYEERPGLASRAYDVQYRTLMDGCFGWSDFFARGFQSLGCEASEIVANCEPMQKQWALENGGAAADEGWSHGIVLEQIRQYRPDVLFWDDVRGFNLGFRTHVRRSIPGIRLHMGWCGTPISAPSSVRDIDVVLVPSPRMVQDLATSGSRVRCVRLAFESSILGRIPVSGQRSGFVFSGSISGQAGFHGCRKRLIGHLLRETDLEIWGRFDGWNPAGTGQRVDRPGERRHARAALARIRRIGLGVLTAGESRRTPQAPWQRYKARLHPAVYGLGMYRLLAGSRVVLNAHIDYAKDFAANMRLFEATGMGATLLTDWKPDLHELFEPDRDVIVYKNEAECVEKARYLMAHPDVCRAVGCAGQSRTLDEHTYAHRVAELFDIVQRLL